MDRSTTGPPILNRSQQALLSSTGPNRPSYPQPVPTGPPILNTSQQALLPSTAPNRATAATRLLPPCRQAPTSPPAASRVLPTHPPATSPAPTNQLPTV